MPNFNALKTTNTAYWARVLGIPAWLLNFPGNSWDTLMDYLTTALATVTPYAPANVTAPVTPGSSPWTYTNASSLPQMVYISGGVVTSVTKNGQSLGNQLPMQVLLAPTKTCVIQYTDPPTVVVDY